MPAIMVFLVESTVSNANAPIDVHFNLSVNGNHFGLFACAFKVFHTPPFVAPIYIILEFVGCGNTRFTAPAVSLNKGSVDNSIELSITGDGPCAYAII